MSRPAVLFEGVGFDGRTILLGVAGFFWYIPTIIGSRLHGHLSVDDGRYRLKTGIYTIICSSLIGLYWRHRRYFIVITR